jgi:UDP-glucose 4-epimerase
VNDRSKILITGGAGFIGNHLVDHILNNSDAEIIVIDNLSRDFPYTIEQNKNEKRLTFIKCDIGNFDHLNRAMRNIDIVFHLAAISNVVYSTQNIGLTFASNIIGMWNVLRIGQKCKIPRLIFTSSREVYGEPISLPVAETHRLRPKNSYGTSKLVSEWLIGFYRKSHGLDARILRLSNVYGPGDIDRVIPNFFHQAKKRLPLKVYGGEQILDFVWVKDVVNILWQASQRTDWIGPLNLGTGIGINILELADMVNLIFKSRLAIQIEPARKIETSRFIADIDRLRTYMKWVPSPDIFGHLNELLEIG